MVQINPILSPLVGTETQTINSEAAHVKQLQKQQEQVKFNKELKKASIELEALHLRNLLGQLRSTEETEDDLFGSSVVKDFFRPMLDEELAKIMAEADGIGIAKMIVEQHSRKE